MGTTLQDELSWTLRTKLQTNHGLARDTLSILGFLLEAPTINAVLTR